MSFLYIVATPIGNLNDTTFRALQTFREVDLILCEDTRRTKQLLNHFEIDTPTISYHQHTRLNKINYIIGLLEKGQSMALVSDAGTPGISDPGNKLVEKVLEALPDKVNIVPVPGPSALIAALSIAGFWTDRFLFLGFPPLKKKKNQFLETVVNSEWPVVFYESPYRILKTLNSLKEIEKQCDKALDLVVCRELTKKFETVYRGNIDKVAEEIKKDTLKGEFVVVVNKLK